MKENMNKIDRMIFNHERILENHNYQRILNLGYAVVKQNKKVVSNVKKLQKANNLSILFRDGEISAKMVD